MQCGYWTKLKTINIDKLCYTNYISGMKGRHTKLNRKISICLAGFFIALTICLSLAEGSHSHHDCKQERCGFCIEIKQLKETLNQMVKLSAIWAIMLLGKHIGKVNIFEGIQGKPSLVEWKIRMNH